MSSKLKVLRYAITLESRFSLNLPKGADILTIQSQDNEPNMWVLVNPDHRIEKRNFLLFGTGHLIKSTTKKGEILEYRGWPSYYKGKIILRYIGTFQINDGGFVGHVFEIRKSRNR